MALSVRGPGPQRMSGWDQTSDGRDRSDNRRQELADRVLAMIEICPRTAMKNTRRQANPVTNATAPGVAAVPDPPNSIDAYGLGVISGVPVLSGRAGPKREGASDDLPARTRSGRVDTAAKMAPWAELRRNRRRWQLRRLLPVRHHPLAHLCRPHGYHRRALQVPVFRIIPSGLFQSPVDIILLYGLSPGIRELLPVFAGLV